MLELLKYGKKKMIGSTENGKAQNCGREPMISRPLLLAMEKNTTPSSIFALRLFTIHLGCSLLVFLIEWMK
jgi:hypothetical protein